MAATREELCMLELIDRLESLKCTDLETGSRNISVKKVTRDPVGIGEADELPFIIIDDTMEASEDFINVEQSVVKKPLLIGLFDAMDIDKNKFVEARKGDLTRGIYVNSDGERDLSMRDLCHIIRIKHIKLDYSETMGNRIRVVALVEIQLPHKIDDPTLIV